MDPGSQITQMYPVKNELKIPSTSHTLLGDQETNLALRCNQPPTPGSRISGCQSDDTLNGEIGVTAHVRGKHQTGGSTDGANSCFSGNETPGCPGNGCGKGHGPSSSVLHRPNSSTSSLPCDEPSSLEVKPEPSSLKNGDSHNAIKSNPLAPFDKAYLGPRRPKVDGLECNARVPRDVGLIRGTDVNSGRPGVDNVEPKTRDGFLKMDTEKHDVIASAFEEEKDRHLTGEGLRNGCSVKETADITPETSDFNQYGVSAGERLPKDNTHLDYPSNSLNNLNHSNNSNHNNDTSAHYKTEIDDTHIISRHHPHGDRDVQSSQPNQNTNSTSNRFQVSDFPDGGTDTNNSSGGATSNGGPSDPRTSINSNAIHPARRRGEGNGVSHNDRLSPQGIQSTILVPSSRPSIPQSTGPSSTFPSAVQPQHTSTTALPLLTINRNAPTSIVAEPLGQEELPQVTSPQLTLPVCVYPSRSTSPNRIEAPGFSSVQPNAPFQTTTSANSGKSQPGKSGHNRVNNHAENDKADHKGPRESSKGSNHIVNDHNNGVSHKQQWSHELSQCEELFGHEGDGMEEKSPGLNQTDDPTATSPVQNSRDQLYLPSQVNAQPTAGEKYPSLSSGPGKQHTCNFNGRPLQHACSTPRHGSFKSPETNAFFDQEILEEAAEQGEQYCISDNNIICNEESANCDDNVNLLTLKPQTNRFAKLSTHLPPCFVRHLDHEDPPSSLLLAHERLTRAGTPGTGVSHEHFRESDDGQSVFDKRRKKPIDSNDDENEGDRDDITDDDAFYTANKGNPLLGKPTIESEPLLSPNENHRQHKQSMAHPVLESYRTKQESLDDDVIPTGHRLTNGIAHSELGEGESGFPNNSTHVDGHLASNGSLFKYVYNINDNTNASTISTDGTSVVGNFTNNGTDVEDGDDVKPCGWGWCSVGLFQRFRSPRWFLLIITLCGACQGMAVNGFVNTVISTLEKRFEISSTESGLIASCYDIMFVILVIPVSYFGGHGNKIRYLGIGILVLGMGSFVFSLPHFISAHYSVEDAQDTLCQANLTTPLNCASGQSSLSNYKYFFFLGQMLHGAGATSLYTLGAVYLDENVPLRSSSLYNGIFYTGAIIGPAVGYMVGAEFLAVYTDPDVDPDDLGLNVNNPKWVGGWWIGFLVSGTIGVLLSLPLLAFPPSLPGSIHYAKERGKERHSQKGVDNTGQHKGIKDILMSIKLLLTNLPFMFINIAAAATGATIAGFSTFLPKFLEYQFSVSPSKSALVVGLAVVPGGGGATFLGGFIVTFFNLKVRGILRLCIVCSCLQLVAALTLLMRCDTGKFAGITSLYQMENQNSTDFLGMQLISDCNKDCNCREEDYYPMCGQDGVLYFSPCYAGCNSVKDEGSTKHYYNCTCLNYNYTGHHDSVSSPHDGDFGKCDQRCALFIPFMCFLTVLIIVTFLTSMPSLTATLRCVPDHQRSFGLGIQWIVARCLGSIPGPILFGKMFDLACLLWQKRCNGNGSCFFYDNHKMQSNLLATTYAFGFVAALAFILANCFYKAKSRNESIRLQPKSVLESFRMSQSTIVPETEMATASNDSKDDEDN